MRTLISRLEEEFWDNVADAAGYTTTWIFRDEHGVVHRVEQPGRDDIPLEGLPENPYEYMPKWDGSWARASDEVLASPNVWIKQETYFKYNAVDCKIFELNVLEALYHAPGHPCVVKYHGAAVNADGFVYGLVFDKLDFMLDDAIEAGKQDPARSPHPEAVMDDVKDGLLYLRNLGYIYTDLNAGNIMWRSDPTSRAGGNWCLIDFTECYKPDQRLRWDLGVGGGIPIGAQFVHFTHVGHSLNRLRAYLHSAIELPYDRRWPGQQAHDALHTQEDHDRIAQGQVRERHHGIPELYGGVIEPPAGFWQQISFSGMVAFSAPPSTPTRKALGWILRRNGVDNWTTHVTFKDLGGTIHRVVVGSRGHQLDELPDAPLDPALYNECLARWREPWVTVPEQWARSNHKVWLKEASKFLGVWSSRQAARELDNLHILQANPHRNICQYIGAVVNADGFVRYLAFEKLQATLAEVVCDVKWREADPSYPARFESIPLDAYTVLTEVCAAINHIRSLGYVYTDLHACNVMWRPATDDTPGAWCLIDFEHCYPVDDIKGVKPQKGKTTLELVDDRTEHDLNSLQDYIYTGGWFPKVDDLYNEAMEVADGVPGQDASEE